MSEILLVLVLRLENKHNSDMTLNKDAAKIRIKSDKLTYFG